MKLPHLATGPTLAFSLVLSGVGIAPSASARAQAVPAPPPPIRVVPPPSVTVTQLPSPPAPPPGAIAEPTAPVSLEHLAFRRRENLPLPQGLPVLYLSRSSMQQEIIQESVILWKTTEGAWMLSQMFVNSGAYVPKPPTLDVANARALTAEEAERIEGMLTSYTLYESSATERRDTVDLGGWAGTLEVMTADHHIIITWPDMTRVTGEKGRLITTLIRAADPD